MKREDWVVAKEGETLRITNKGAMVIKGPSIRFNWEEVSLLQSLVDNHAKKLQERIFMTRRDVSHRARLEEERLAALSLEERLRERLQSAPSLPGLKK